MAEVVALGYVVIAAEDLDAWSGFAINPDRSREGGDFS
jgi:hypothetical protein